MSYFLGSDIRRHGNDGHVWRNRSDIYRGRHTIHVGHDNVHKDDVESIWLLIYLVYGFLTILLPLYVSEFVLGGMACRDEICSLPQVPLSNQSETRIWILFSSMSGRPQRGRFSVSSRPTRIHPSSSSLDVVPGPGSQLVPVSWGMASC